MKTKLIFLCNLTLSKSLAKIVIVNIRHIQRVQSEWKQT